ncbi:MAG TPA: preprotein translocase subunit YajC [Acidimicrobiales bacterium]|nr:preprotein translocase subunit YajC [Acidimicrobiales bacterium]
MYSLAVVLAASTKNTTSAGSAAGSLIFLVVIFAAAYFLFLRPRSQAARRQRETLTEVGPGDEVLTGAGIFGTVLDVEADRVTIETAPGTRLTILRSTIARRLGPDREEYEAEPDHDHDEASHAEIEPGDGKEPDDDSGHRDEGSAE